MKESHELRAGVNDSRKQNAGGLLDGDTYPLLHLQQDAVHDARAGELQGPAAAAAGLAAARGG